MNIQAQNSNYNRYVGPLSQMRNPKQELHTLMTAWAAVINHTSAPDILALSTSLRGSFNWWGLLYKHVVMAQFLWQPLVMQHCSITWFFNLFYFIFVQGPVKRFWPVYSRTVKTWMVWIRYQHCCVVAISYMQS